jgi:streptogramin lyase
MDFSRIARTGFTAKKMHAAAGLAAVMLACAVSSLHAQAGMGMGGGANPPANGQPAGPPPDSTPPVNDLPNPYQTISDWATLPPGMTWGGSGGVGFDPAGHIWVLQRCGGNTCAGSAENPIIEFDKSGKYLKSFGSGMFVTPHGLAVDSRGHIWATDFAAKDGKGMQVFEFDQDGKVLLTLGKAGVAGDGDDEFSQPVAVAIAGDGDIFVADGHGNPGSNYRVVKFDKNGKFIKAWGTKGSGPGQFNGMHAIFIDGKGRVLVGDRGNNRIEIFDQDGNYITEWKQFGRPSGIYIDKKNNIYVADADSNAKSHPGWQRGIRVGSATDGSVKYFIPDPNTNPNLMGSSAAEGVAADSDGTIYGAEVTAKDLKKYVKKQ